MPCSCISGIWPQGGETKLNSGGSLSGGLDITTNSSGAFFLMPRDDLTSLLHAVTLKRAKPRNSNLVFIVCPSNFSKKAYYFFLEMTIEVMMRTAVVIYNLGGPCCMKAVEPFLFNLFKDPAIISLPNPFRFLLAKFISSRRTSKASAIYEQMGGGSTILPETYNQAMALEKALGLEYKVFTYMRYTYPMISDVLDDIELYKPDKIVLLPLYPQYSTTTTASSIKEWNEETIKRGLKTEVSSILSYQTHEGFISAYAQLLEGVYKEAAVIGKPVILFSAHGIPTSRIKAGDPYEKHVNESVAAIISKADLRDVEAEVCYQSKVGRLEWLLPATDQLIEKYSKENRVIIVVPVSFVSEHSETLVELDIQYKELAESHGAMAYFRVPTVGTHPLYIKCLRELVTNA